MCIRDSTWSVGTSPRGLAWAGGPIWVASGAFAAAEHKGGTLTVAEEKTPGGEGVIDPAAVDDPATLSAERLVYDGLVTHAMSGGAAGLAPVPDPAVALPRPSNGNKTYACLLYTSRAHETVLDLVCRLL